jgi:hypothetical protein
MAKHFLASMILMVLVSSASAAGAASSSSSYGSTDYCKTKDSCSYEDAMDLCVDERYVPIYDDVDLCDTDDEPHYDGPTECQAEELDLCDDDKEETKKTYADGCTSEYVFNKAIKDFMKSKPTDATAASIRESLPMLMGSDVFDYTGGEPVPDEKLAAAEGMIKGAGDIFMGMGLMRKCGDPEPVKKVVVAVVKPKLGNVIYGNLQMKLDGSRSDAEDAATSVLASALQVPEAAIIKANLVRVTGGRRLQDQSSDLPTYRLQYEVAVPPGQTAELVLAKANNLPQTIPAKFAEYGVTVTDVVNLTPPLTLTRNHGLFLATTTTLTPITEKMTWLQVVSRAVLLIIPCFAGYLGSIPGFEQKFCCK